LYDKINLKGGVNMVVKCYGQVAERELGASDVVMYNGVCYQIITQKVVDSNTYGDTYSPGLTHDEAKRFISDGTLVLVAIRKEPIFKEIILKFYMLKEDS